MPDCWVSPFTKTKTSVRIPSRVAGDGMITEPVLFDDYRDVPKDSWPWQNFTPREMGSRGVVPALLVVPVFMDKLQSLRDFLGFALPVTSGYRTPDHNMAVSSSGRAGPHTTGRAIDIKIFGTDAFELIEIAVTSGFTGIGVKQCGPRTRRFIHLDDLPKATRCPRPWVWSYP